MNGAQLKQEVGFYSTIGSGTAGLFYWLNKGFTAFEGSLNPTTRDVQYIGDANKTVETTALQQSYTFTCENYRGDEVSDDMYAIEKEKLQGILNHTRTIVRADLKDPFTVPGWFAALKADYNVIVEGFDQGAPGEVVSGSGQYSRLSDVAAGWFNISTKEWSDTEPTA